MLLAVLALTMLIQLRAVNAELYRTKQSLVVTPVTTSPEPNFTETATTTTPVLSGGPHPTASATSPTTTVHTTESASQTSPDPSTSVIDDSHERQNHRGTTSREATTTTTGTHISRQSDAPHSSAHPPTTTSTTSATPEPTSRIDIFHRFSLPDLLSNWSLSPEMLAETAKATVDPLKRGIGAFWYLCRRAIYYPLDPP